MSKETIYYIIIGIVYLYFQYAKWKKANPSTAAKPAKPAKATTPVEQRAPVSIPTPKKIPNKYTPDRAPAPKPIYERLEDTQFSYESPTLIRVAAEKKAENAGFNSKQSQKGAPTEKHKFLYADIVVDKKVNPYAEKLKNPANVKEAFIFAEILNKKYT
jgi:hypothetical protein